MMKNVQTTLFYARARRCRFAFPVLLLWIGMPVLLAVENTPVSTPAPIELPSIAGYFFRVLLSLVAIIFLSYGVLKLVKKQQDLQQKMNDKTWIRVLDYQGLGPNRGLYLVELLSGLVVIGVTEGNISIIKEIDSRDETWNDLGQILQKREDSPPPRMWGWFFKGKKSPDSPAFQEPFQRELEQQLNRSRHLHRQAAKGVDESE